MSFNILKQNQNAATQKYRFYFRTAKLFQFERKSNHNASSTFSMVKRFESYETLGALFRQSKAETLELTVKERIYLIIIEIVTEISLKTDFELDFLIEHICAVYQQFTNLGNSKTTAIAA